MLADARACAYCILTYPNLNPTGAVIIVETERAHPQPYFNSAPQLRLTGTGRLFLLLVILSLQRNPTLQRGLIIFCPNSPRLHPVYHLYVLSD